MMIDQFFPSSNAIRLPVTLFAVPLILGIPLLLLRRYFANTFY
jgi:hypothetical protein